MQDVFGKWSPPFFLTLACILSLVVYVRGALLVRKTRPELSPPRMAAFCAGIAVLWLALASPIEELADTVLTAHMVEHLLLMSVVPPLLLVGWPTVPILRGLPVRLRHTLLHPLLRSRSVRVGMHRLASPVIAWMLMNVTLLLWHVPAAYDFALQHEGWHDVEHICFLGTSLLFWWVLLRPWPARPNTMGWGVLLYLISADFVNTALSATLAFVGHPVYHFYLGQQNPFGMTALQDQVLGASIMWVFGSIAFLLPALVMVSRLLSGK